MAVKLFKNFAFYIYNVSHYEKLYQLVVESFLESHQKVLFLDQWDEEA